jgi:hypothetical protein
MIEPREACVRDGPHSELPRDTPRGDVLGTHQGDAPGHVERAEGQVEARGGPFQGIAAAPVAAVDDGADIDLGAAVHFVRQQPNLADGLTECAIDGEPVAVTVAGVARLLAQQPRLGLAARVRSRPVPHDVRVGQLLNQELQVAGTRFAHQQPRGLDDRRHAAQDTAIGTATAWENRVLRCAGRRGRAPERAGATGRLA